MLYFWWYTPTVHSSSPELLLCKHMLATPLTSLQLCLQDSLSKSAVPLQLQPWAQQASTALERMNDILYFFTNPQQVSQKSFFVQDSIDKLQKLFAQHMNVIHFTILTRDSEQLRLTGNSFLLEEAVVCLIKNGLESYTCKNDACVVVTIWHREKKLYISIKDFGRGITLWQRWLLTLPRISGKLKPSGIGFPFAREVIQKIFHGEVQLYSVPKLGTEVICLLPLR
jgi:C4-dicarboxylate-specific signal transduction histidine kinase